MPIADPAPRWTSSNLGRGLVGLALTLCPSLALAGPAADRGAETTSGAASAPSAQATSDVATDAAPSEAGSPAPSEDGLDPSNPDRGSEPLGAVDDTSRDEGVEYVDDDAPSEGPAPEAGPETGPETEATASDESTDSAGGDGEAIRPPRVDGPYVGGLVFGAASFATVLNLETPDPLWGGGAFIQAGDAVFTWMSVGVAIGGQVGGIGDQTIYEGGLLVELAFVPAKRYPLSLRTGFGFGGGVIREAGNPTRFGFGGALFKASVRYEFFPLAAKRRPDRGGGWAIGPELGWLGATPAARGQPFVNTILLGLSTSFYFGS